MTIDWTRIGWWDLPGPSRFCEEAVDRIASDDGGITGLSLPERRPTGLIEALASAVEARRGLRVANVDPSELGHSRSPAHALAAAAGAPPGSIRSTADFVGSRDLADMVFIIDAIAPDAWASWSLFFRSFRAERRRAERVTAPSLAVVVPPSLPQGEIMAAIGDDHVRWRDIVSRADMQLFVEAALGRSNSLAERVAAATVTEVACWDSVMVGHLASQPIEDQIDPRAMLGALDLDFGVPSWSNGLVDIMDGVPHIHTLALVGSAELLARRIWRAHVGIIFPAIEQVRQVFVSRYFHRLASRLPYTRTFNNDVKKVYNHPLELEINDVFYFLKHDINAWEADLLYNFKTLRTSMAHMEPANAPLLVKASRGWDAVLGNADAAPDLSGWDWPRCGQRLTLLVGPSGAGKTTYAAANYPAESVLSSDVIREELYGSKGMAGSQEAIFTELRRRARILLAAGRSVVIDATNLRRLDRLLNVDLAPRDIAIDYILIDRPMAEKERDGGWRLERPGLLATHARIFAAELADILDGDGRPNVTVIDKRTVVELSGV